MSAPNTLSKPAAIRRTRFAIQTAALLFAVTACCAFVGILADRFPRRFDATATREHHLSERTEKMLASLDGDYELVVAANFSTLDPQAARRTEDVLDNFARSSPHVHTTIIDAASSHGVAELDALMTRLVERFRPELDRQKDGLARATIEAGKIAAGLNDLSDQLLAMGNGVQTGEPSAEALKRILPDFAARCRVAAEDATKAVGTAGESSTRTIGRTPLPATDEALDALRRSHSAGLEQISSIATTLDQMARSTDDALLSPAIREQSRAAGAGATAVRSEIGRSLASLDDLPRTPLASVVRVLERTSAAIVIAPPSKDRKGPGVTSIDLTSIYPARSAVSDSGGLRIDLRARTEELLSSALVSLSREDLPIVVFVHGRNGRLAPGYSAVLPIVDRLQMRGVDFAEWAVGLDTEPPALRPLDPGGKRPVVYIVLGMSPGADDGQRFAKLINTVNRLIGEGRRMLVCEVPSTLQSLGQPDPMAEALVPLGVKLDSGRVLLRQVAGPRGRTVSPDVSVIDPETDHPIAGAIKGLEVSLPYALPVRIADGASGVKPVVMIDNQGKSVWAESEWLSFSQTPTAQQPLLIDPPSPDGSRDDPAGPWPVVVSVERTVGSTAQRVVVVGCTKWLSREVIGAEVEVEGRRVSSSPGNMELLDACVSWLAGQDSMISTSPTAQAVPLIPPLSEAKVAALKWGLIGGLPILILLIGAVWRLVRG